MGFLDKAKKMAEQAQTKLDEVQKQFNEQQGNRPPQGGPVVEYDNHGRPVGVAGAGAAPTAPMSSAPPPAPPAPPTPGLPVTEAASAPPPPVPPAAPAPPAPGLPDTAGGPPHEDSNFPSYAPPTLTSGDPLAG